MSPVGVRQCYLDRAVPETPLMKEVISCPSGKAPRGLILPNSAVLTTWEIACVHGDTKRLGANGISATFLAVNIEQELKMKLAINMRSHGDSLENVFYSSLNRFMYSC